jgi:hypothetical protein
VTKEVKMITPILPPEVPYGVGFNNLEMLAIREGSELLLYGDNSNIWKYSVVRTVGRLLVTSY